MKEEKWPEREKFPKGESSTGKMKARTRKIIVAVFAAIVILTSAYLAAVYLNSEPSSVEKIMLSANDFDQGGWTEVGSQFPSARQSNQSYGGSAQFMNGNGTLNVSATMFVFDLIKDARLTYHNMSAFYLRWDRNATGATVIGDSVTIVNDSGRYGTFIFTHFILVFLRENVVVTMDIHYMGGAPLWVFGTLVHIAQLQVEKIDRYLAE